MRACIKAISYHLPEHVVTNEDLCRKFPHLTPEDIYKRTGIKKRYRALVDDPVNDPKSSDMAVLSTEKLFEEHDIDRATIDYLLLCTEVLDHKAPTTASGIHYRLGLNGACGAVDIPNGCTGYIYGLSLAKGLIESGQARHILLITADVPSYCIHPENEELLMLFSDSSATTLISAERSEDGGVGKFVFGTDGSGAENLIAHNSGVRGMITKEWLEKYKDANGMPYGILEMNGAEIFIFALKTVPKLVRSILEKEGLQPEDIDLFIFHQANGFLLNVLRRKLNIPEEKFFIYLEDVGNTVAATIPIALKEAMVQGKAEKGDRILLAAFGIGYSWSATIVTL